MTFAVAIAATVLLAPCPHSDMTTTTYGCALPSERTIYLNPAHTGPDVRRGILWHERGHIYSYWALNEAERAAIIRKLGWSHWREEAFADQFAACQANRQGWKSKAVLPHPRRGLCVFTRGPALTE